MTHPASTAALTRRAGWRGKPLITFLRQANELYRTDIGLVLGSHSGTSSHRQPGFGVQECRSSAGIFGVAKATQSGVLICVFRANGLDRFPSVAAQNEIQFPGTRLPSRRPRRAGLTANPDVWSRCDAKPENNPGYVFPNRGLHSMMRTMTTHSALHLENWPVAHLRLRRQNPSLVPVRAKPGLRKLASDSYVGGQICSRQTKERYERATEVWSQAILPAVGGTFEREVAITQGTVM
ncbi:hypothetical protein MYCTH_90516 [Thermothelomyces thermophilus ATCC 42464]|uniref:Uncharacterized protein n=1 Tax=Thermothelomyces thermophilus (strain ATCC 42464 / BCRC 31852 / DSM 1799) TaxID=573729 RepID=G2QMC5_THET4|nr:uncharacterized protein MYCTH_90516 [Thermothelomyces thermophilus ATCC 42464]AEO61105.1 hypothetical protein MYCTH_90516 [Thermothelomyces thermophilus ATCC 42464]